MANKALRQFLSGVFNPKGYVADFRHAARTFTDDTFRLAPKLKFNFHVAFFINPLALKSINLRERHRYEINVLVKKADLPKFSIPLETANQYNRKKLIQTKIDYTPLNLTFHDDNLNIVSTMWKNYYSYYYADHNTAQSDDGVASYMKNATLNSNYSSRYKYGLDNNSAVPFFDKIVMYQMGRKTYQSYTLIKPMISAWNHDTVDFGQSGGAENMMTIAYEGVHYAEGAVVRGNPVGFAVDHYDTTPSPITLAGGGTRSLFGPGGVIAGASSVFGDLYAASQGQQVNLFATAINAVNTYNNTQQLSGRGVNEELTRTLIAGTAALGNRGTNIGQPGVQGVSGTRNISFPVADAATTTPAILRNITGR
jgi:hypothetical protein